MDGLEAQLCKFITSYKLFIRNKVGPKLDAFMHRAAPYETVLLQSILRLPADSTFRAFPSAELHASMSLPEKSCIHGVLLQVVRFLALDLLCLAWEFFFSGPESDPQRLKDHILPRANTVPGLLGNMAAILLFNWAFLAKVNSVIRTLDDRAEETRVLAISGRRMTTPYRNMGRYLSEALQLFLYLRCLVLVSAAYAVVGDRAARNHLGGHLGERRRSEVYWLYELFRNVF
ncbi:hypothetical protein PG996_006782 [Apiospora saccharicola]|uniref:Uncharacterized protein n=1 Tax=Apiospora saccharicola TaxID=335842 RepID=A0ABR1VBQ0_9PEZI